MYFLIAGYIITIKITDDMFACYLNDINVYMFIMCTSCVIVGGNKKGLEEYQLSHSILKFLNYLGGFR